MSMVRWIAASLLALGCMGANAQGYPGRPVKIVVAFSPGGGTDIVARVLGQKLTEMWGQQVIVENRAGASGTIGTEYAARSAPDGYTLFMGTLEITALSAAVVGDTPEQFGAAMRADSEKWARVIREAGIKAE